MEIRTLQEYDEDAAYAVICASLDEYFVPEIVSYFRLQWPTGQLIACDPFGHIVGYLAGSRLQNGRASIALFAVEPGLQHRGVGSQLLAAFRQRAMMEGYRAIQLEVRTTNAGAVAFYQRRGFMPVENLPDFYKDHGNAVRMIGPCVPNC